MNRVVIPLKTGERIDRIRDGDIIVYDANRKDFYITTPEMFFTKYDEKLEKLLARYDSQVAKMQKQIIDLEQQMADFLEMYKKTNEKIIAMVENQITEGSK